MAYTEKQREYNRRWREKDPKRWQRQLARVRQWREENRAKWLEIHQATRSRPEYKEREKKRAVEDRRNNPFKSTARKARQRAKKKNLECNIDPKYLQTIWTGMCPILGVPLQIGKKRGTISELNLASLDRLDNAKGYIKGNVHFVSFRVNNIKTDATFEEFEQIYEWWRETRNESQTSA